MRIIFEKTAVTDQQPVPEEGSNPNPITVPNELNQIAILIRRQWTGMYFGAVPYVEAMLCLKTIDDNFGQDSARSIVTYFLGNAKTWRGEIAKAVKSKLKELMDKGA
jgi:hypothetical protein